MEGSYSMTEISKAIAKDLLTIEAVFLRPNEPFTWASGIKSPIYCDNRMTMSYPAVRKAIASGLAAQIKRTLSRRRSNCGYSYCWDPSCRLGSRYS